MTSPWGPPATKTAATKTVRAHTDAFCQFGYRPTEIRLNEHLRKLWDSGKTTPQVATPTGINLNVNTKFRFYPSVPWDYIEYLAVGPSGKGRHKRTSTYLTPPDLDLAAADIYYRLRHRNVAPAWAHEAAPGLRTLATRHPTVDLVALHTLVADSAATPGDAVDAVARLIV